MWEEAGFVCCTKYWMTSDCTTRPRGQRINNQMTHLVEGENVEPGAFIACWIQGDSHGVLLQQGGQPLVNSQIFVRLDVQQLDHISVLRIRQSG